MKIAVKKKRICEGECACILWKFRQYLHLLLGMFCLCNCVSIQPLEPGAAVYPPGKHFRYDMVPSHCNVVAMPVTGLVGDPRQFKMTISDSYNAPLIIEEGISIDDAKGYLIYKLNKDKIYEKYTDLGVQNPPSQINIEIKDLPDRKERIMTRLFRWWGRSDNVEYYIIK